MLWCQTDNTASAELNIPRAEALMEADYTVVKYTTREYYKSLKTPAEELFLQRKKKERLNEFISIPSAQSESKLLPKLKTRSPAPFVRSTKIPLVIFGNAMFGDKNSMRIKGKQHGIVDIIWRELKQRERAGELIAITINEYLSSQICHSCGQRNLEKVTTSDNICHYDVLVFKHCQTLWQRDVLASKNLLWIATSVIAGYGRPIPFLRPTLSFTATKAGSLAREIFYA